MSLPTKILLAIGVVLTLGVLGFIVYQQYELKNQQTAIQTSLVSQQQLIDGIVRSQSTYATAAQLSQFASDNGVNLQAIQDNLKTLNSQLAAINITTVDSSGQTTTNVPSSGTGPNNPTPPAPTTVACTPGGTATCPNQDPFGYQKTQQNLVLNEDFGTLKVPFGTVGFSSWSATPWDVNILPRVYNVDTVVGVDVNERQTFYNKFSVTVGGQSYDIPITTATTEQQVPTSSFSWFNPRLFLTTGGSVDLSQIAGDVNLGGTLGIMSYGNSVVNPDISVLQVGVGYQVVDKSASIIVNPVSFNIEHLLPNGLVRNTYVGPSIQVGFQGHVFAGLNLSLGL